jgi:hypothetical protein
MASQLIAFSLDSGGTVFVETEPDQDTGALVGRNNAIAATQTFEQALSHLKPVADAVLEQVMALASRPDEVLVELGVSLKAEAGVIIAKTAGEGSLKLTLKWKKAD